MPTFLMFGRYSAEALKTISEERTQKAIDLVTNHGGEVKAIYGTLGEYDVLFIVNLPDFDYAIKLSISLNKLTGISFSTSPAVDIKEFDHLMSDEH